MGSCLYDSGRVFIADAGVYLAQIVRKTTAIASWHGNRNGTGQITTEQKSVWIQKQFICIPHCTPHLPACLSPLHMPSSALSSNVLAHVTSPASPPALSPVPSPRCLAARPPPSRQKRRGGEDAPRTPRRAPNHAARAKTTPTRASACVCICMYVRTYVCMYLCTI
jgi:hypothetical protein